MTTEPSQYERAILHGIQRKRQTVGMMPYMGTADEGKVAKSRARNKAARKSRRINRSR